jgi:spore coat polysaccharide biosynthesis protein SpsF (cytidylyltransferase family)
MSSKRLPGKALINLCGKSLLERVIGHARNISNINHFCLATSTDESDDCLELMAKNLGIECYRGSLENVTLRAIGAAKKNGYDSFVRICGDRPFIDSKIYESMINSHLFNKNDLTTNIFPRTVPPGLTCEIILTKSLEKMYSLTDEKQDLEHVTRFFYNSTDIFKIQNINFSFTEDEVNLRLVIDNEKDLNRTKWILSELGKKNVNDTKTVISLTKEWEKK